jgi:hypothetical protein
MDEDEKKPESDQHQLSLTTPMKHQTMTQSDYQNRMT